MSNASTVEVDRCLPSPCKSEGLQLDNVIRWARAEGSLSLRCLAASSYWVVRLPGALLGLFGQRPDGVVPVPALLWQRKELRLRDRFLMIVLGGLLGPGMVMGTFAGMQNADPACTSACTSGY